MARYALGSWINDYYDGLEKKKAAAAAAAQAAAPAVLCDVTQGTDWLGQAEAIAQEMDDQVESRLAGLGDPSDHA